ncbi:FAD-dependent oxidoreductase [Sphingomonas sp.]|uniref:FAD-dependent oxidoreductase n=1 Tax=Sphingomonas sp. TaxID=28214 RepID=UPI002BCF7A41|nr:FAD-dependent oxidoreductase [Sphingomonas sp.]HTG37966.1 FAD-dependent oxidoreductase [Sphingomonas sp.]
MKADRRTAIALGAGAVATAGGGAAIAFRSTPLPPGPVEGATPSRGHRLRQGDFPAPARTERAGIVIIGGGIAGLAAGWTLAEAGFTDFRLLEIEDAPGGNARSGANAVSDYPLGAHYLPIPNREAVALRRMLARLGVITGEADGLPVYDPAQLCADLQERLLWRGRWQEGLVPTTGLTPQDRTDLARFDTLMADARRAIGRDGRPAFATPIAYSSRDPDWLALDQQSFAAWLDARGLTSPLLRAHVRYAMRDDYGTEPDAASAWAGVHYFAGRRGHAAAGVADNVLTWPGGNGHLAQAMATRFPDRIATGRIVHRVMREDGGAVIDSFDIAKGTTTRIHADAAILATPLFITSRLCGEPGDVSACTYAPWLVANVTVARPPRGPGVPLAWDNVSSTSDSLGYVVATHQSRALPGETVLSWYMPLSDMTPAVGRCLLLERSADEWKRIVRDDLLTMHPDLEIREIALSRWGHAMIRPTPGYIWQRRQGFTPPPPPLYLAHSDLSGLSLFEEAHWQGCRAAEGAMALIGHAHEALT